MCYKTTESVYSISISRFIIYGILCFYYFHTKIMHLQMYDYEHLYEPKIQTINS